MGQERFELIMPVYATGLHDITFKRLQFNSVKSAVKRPYSVTEGNLQRYSYTGYMT